MLADSAIVAGLLCWLVLPVCHPKQCKLQNSTSMAAVICTLLTIYQFNSGTVYSIVSNTASAMLIIATLASGSPDSLLGFLYVVMGSKHCYMLYHATNFVLPAVTIVAHMVCAWNLFSLHIQQQIIKHICRTFYVDGFKTVKNLYTQGISSDAFYDPADRQDYNNFKHNFHWNPKEKYGMMRAVIRMAWFPMVTTHGIKTILKIAAQAQEILLLQICGSFAENSLSSTAFWHMLFVWVASFVVQLGDGYAGSASGQQVQFVSGVIREKLLEHYLKQNNALHGYTYDIKTIMLVSQYYTYQIWGAIGELCSFMILVANLSMIAYKIGWLASIPLAIMILVLAVTVFADIWIATNASTLTTKHTTGLESPYTLLYNMHNIKKHAWTHTFLNKITHYVCSPQPWLEFCIKETANRLSAYAANIAGAVTIIIYASGAEKITFTELSILLLGIKKLMGGLPALQNIEDYIKEILLFEQHFQDCAQLLEKVYTDKQPLDAADNWAVDLTNCQFSWGNDKFSLPAIDLHIAPGSFITITGPVGSGKSSLLSAMCGEMPLIEGKGVIYGRLGYVSQKPWIMNATFRENILLGNSYDEHWYNKVVYACALITDLQQLAAGDQTEIGHKGINLSGGQKARLALARAIYNQADVYILDDILAAVDAQVEQHLVDCVLSKQGIIGDKTRILVTHAEHVVPLSDQQLVLNNGHVRVVEIDANTATKLSADNHDAADTDTSIDNNAGSSGNSDQFNVNPELENIQYHYYDLCKFIWQSGVGIFAGVVAINAIVSYMTYYLESQQRVLIPVSSKSMDYDSVKQYVLLQLAISVAVYELNGISNTVLTNIWRAKATVSMRKKLTAHLANSSITAYERLSVVTIAELYCAIDMTTFHLVRDISIKLGNIFKTISSMFGVLTVSVYGMFAVMVPAYAIMHISMWLEKVTAKFEAQVKGKLDIKAKELVNEVANGHEIFRIHEKDEVFVNRIAQVNADCAGVSFRYDSMYDIYERGIQAVEMLMIAGVVILAKYLSFYSQMTVGPGQVTQWVQLTRNTFTYINEIANNHDTFAKHLPFLAKYFVFAEQIEQETSTSIMHQKPPASWPSKGTIEFRGYDLRYRPGLDLVLQQLNCTIGRQEKVGIVGRTGAGKSSLTYALLRLVEPAAGSISIDGIDISTLDLTELRTRISIVPQDPLLFAGTFRENLDPVGEFTDDQLWTAIDKAHIRNLLQDTGLATRVDDQGSNFSVGQKQLISLCRALLAQRKIVILDEATANVDTQTDQLMQSIIKKEFAECTVLTIAHRLQSVMDSDRIMVMDQGKIAEFDTPQKLLANKSSQFSQLVSSMKHNTQAIN